MTTELQINDAAQRSAASSSLRRARFEAHRARVSRFQREREELEEAIAYAVEAIPYAAHGEAPSPRLTWSPHLSAILAGTKDDASPLSLFRGLEDGIVKQIYQRLFELWETSVTRTHPARNVIQMRHARDYRIIGDVIADGIGRRLLPDSTRVHGRWYSHHCVSDHPEIAFSPCGPVTFPEPRGINVNMLPFIMGRRDSLPDELQPYHDLILQCPTQDSELGKVCYLTVAEGNVESGSTQRRGGLHIEALNANTAVGCTGKASCSFTAAPEHRWGVGVMGGPDEMHGGIFMASTVGNTCAVWNALVEISAVDTHGGMEHLRPFLGPRYRLGAGELVWITDRTPHEALPQGQTGHRQFFRLVTSEISVWFKKHSTPNPKVPLPEVVKVIHESKFD